MYMCNLAKSRIVKPTKNGLFIRSFVFYISTAAKSSANMWVSMKLGLKTSSRNFFLVFTK